MTTTYTATIYCRADVVEGVYQYRIIADMHENDATIYAAGRDMAAIMADHGITLNEDFHNPDADGLGCDPEWKMAEGTVTCTA